MSDGTPRAVGLIANPASGKDIRRLVGHASVADNNEKVRVVRRVLLALDAAGVRRVLVMPDYYNIGARAADGAGLRLSLHDIETRFTAREVDTTDAAAAMERAGVSVIITLGGDGTNRAAALGARNTPLIPISTGTNNVFPTMVEGAVAGLAGAVLALGLARADEVVQRSKCLEVTGDLLTPTLALIDVAVMEPGFPGARAVWDPTLLRRLLLTRASATYMGLAGLGGLLHDVTDADAHGLDVRFGRDGTKLLAPIAPGLFREVSVASFAPLAAGQPVRVDGPCLLALDGEREVEVRAGGSVTVTLARAGPPVVDVGACLRLGAARGLLRL